MTLHTGSQVYEICVYLNKTICYVDMMALRTNNQIYEMRGHMICYLNKTILLRLTYWHFALVAKFHKMCGPLIFGT